MQGTRGKKLDLAEICKRAKLIANLMTEFALSLHPCVFEVCNPPFASPPDPPCCSRLRRSALPSAPIHRIEIDRKATRVGTFEVCVSTHVSLRMFIMQVLASQLPFLANRNAELAVPPLFWPDNCIKIGGHVALLSGPTVYTVANC